MSLARGFSTQEYIESYNRTHFIEEKEEEENPPQEE